MARQRLVCGSCDSQIPRLSFCPTCGTPTRLASSQERMLWEMGQIAQPAVAPVPAKPSAINLGPAETARPRRMEPGRPTLGTAGLVDGSAAVAIPIEQLDLRSSPKGGRRGGGDGGRRPAARPSDPERRHPASDDLPAPRPSADERGKPTERRSPVPHPATGSRKRQDREVASDASDERPPRIPADEASARPQTRAPAPRSRIPVPPRARTETRETKDTDPQRTPAPQRRDAAPQAGPRPSRLKEPRPSRLSQRPSRLKDRPKPQQPVPAEESADAQHREPPQDGRTLVIKRRTGEPPEPLPNPVDTASALREISERPVKVSRKERRARRKAEEAAAKHAAKQAKAEAKRAAKQASKTKKGDVAPAESQPVEDDDAPDTRSATAATAHQRRSWRERRAEKLLDAIGAVEGETMEMMVDGRARLRSATLIVTTYRVATISRGTRKRVLGWIPLEEIERVKRVWRGAATLHIEGSFERLSFQAGSDKAFEEAAKTVKGLVKQARRGSERHHPDIIQLWCERTNEIWESEANRLRLWIRKHPIVTVTSLGSMVPVAFLASQRFL